MTGICGDIKFDSLLQEQLSYDLIRVFWTLIVLIIIYSPANGCDYHVWGDSQCRSHDLQEPVNMTSLSPNESINDMFLWDDKQLLHRTKTNEIRENEAQKNLPHLRRVWCVFFKPSCVSDSSEGTRHHFSWYWKEEKMVIFNREGWWTKSLITKDRYTFEVIDHCCI